MHTSMPEKKKRHTGARKWEDRARSVSFRGLWSEGEVAPLQHGCSIEQEGEPVGAKVHLSTGQDGGGAAMDVVVHAQELRNTEHILNS